MNEDLIKQLDEAKAGISQPEQIDLTKKRALDSWANSLKGGTQKQGEYLNNLVKGLEKIQHRLNREDRLWVGWVRQKIVAGDLDYSAAIDRAVKIINSDNRLGKGNQGRFPV